MILVMQRIGSIIVREKEMRSPLPTLHTLAQVSRFLSLIRQPGPSKVVKKEAEDSPEEKEGKQPWLSSDQLFHSFGSVLALIMENGAHPQ